jgi:hypothetical protein
MSCFGVYGFLSHCSSSASLIAAPLTTKAHVFLQQALSLPEISIADGEEHVVSK